MGEAALGVSGADEGEERRGGPAESSPPAMTNDASSSETCTTARSSDSWAWPWRYVSSAPQREPPQAPGGRRTRSPRRDRRTTAHLASERSPTNVSIVDHDATTTVQVDVDAELPDLTEVRDRTTTLNGQLIVSPGDASTRINARPPDTTRCLNAAGRRPHAERCLQHRVGAGVRCLRQLQIRPERSVQLLVHEEPSQ